MGGDDRFSAVKTDTRSPGLNTCSKLVLRRLYSRGDGLSAAVGCYPNSCSFHLAKGLKLLGCVQPMMKMKVMTEVVKI
jgi:hypothetical protein